MSCQDASCNCHHSLRKGKQFTRYSGWYSKLVTYIPWEIEINGRWQHLSSEVHDTGRQYDEIKSRSEIARLIWQLRKNGYRYITRYSRQENPLDMINWAKENEFTFEVFGKSLIYEENGFMQFHGNFCEYSNAFNYIIYDEVLANEIKKLISTMPNNLDDGHKKIRVSEK